MQRLRAVGAVLTGVALLASVTACGGEDKASSDEPVVVNITIEDGKVDPSGDRVDVGDVCRDIQGPGARRHSHVVCDIVALRSMFDRDLDRRTSP